MAEKAFAPNRLKEAMGGMSNIELAEKLGCAKSNISMYMSGQRVPSNMTVQLMAICLGVNPAWLMGLDAPKYIDKTTFGITTTKQALLDIINDADEETLEHILELISSIKKLKRSK